MPKFFVDKNQITEDTILITGENAHHISRSLRMASGEKITVSDMQGFDYDCVLESFTDNSVTAKITNKYLSKAEPEIRVHLYQALPKGDKLDLIIQKSVECGAYDITPFESTNCVVKIKGDAESKKSDRRNKIALEAAKQCGRGIIPKVNPSITFNDMLMSASNSDVILFCYEGDGTLPMANALKKIRSEKIIKDISIIIGSEGGFSPTEVAEAEKCGFIKIGLGKRILRAETAAIMSLACIVYEFELD
ncbi:MAG: 16S rRNA (uracil(1498)-N(3))-methyltransferase [Clostridia bacterium]|nr:16S rRNA (uracil(1498)-N(3))-methyltransferase [Clostridia bacterium]